MTDTERLAALLIEVFPAANRNQWPFAAMDVAAALVAAGVRVLDDQTPVDMSDYMAGYRQAQADGLDVERVAAFLHEEYGCRITCRGGRLADDRHPSHNEAYRDQAERLVAASKPAHDALRAAARAWLDHYGPIETYTFAGGGRGMVQLDHGGEEYEHRMDVVAALRAALRGDTDA